MATQASAPTPDATPRRRATLIGLLLAVAGIGATVAAAWVTTRPGGREGPSRGEVMLRMQYYNQSLGVDCTYCHVPGKFDIVTPRMRTTRWMEEKLVKGLVTRPDHRSIDCHTCHDGRARFLPSSP